MKFIQLFCVLILGLLLGSCQSGASTGGTLIEVNLANAGGLTANMDRITINGPNEMLKNTTIDANGRFAFAFEQPLSNGIYQIRVGAQKAAFVLTDDDREVEIDGELGNFSNYDFNVDGSASAQELAQTMNYLRENAQSVDDIMAAVTGTDNPSVGAFIAYASLGRAGAVGLPIHRAAVERMPADDPNREGYSAFIDELAKQIAMQQSRERIQVGQPAPPIALKSPDGKEYTLDELKGKVVLLDFWASWCGPCRRENPNVVKVYNKYKDQGFTIYSVSLDGLDPRRTAGMSPEEIQRGNEGQLQRWVQAIEKDGLVWDYHVSELKKWSGEVSANYGVTGIPKTFLIDRDGKIAAVGLRGAAQIEQALQQVL